MNQDAAQNRPPKKPSLLRRKFLIDKGEQLKVVLYLSVVIAVFIAASSAALYSLMDKAIENVMFTSHLKFDSLGEAFWPILVKVNIIYFVAVMAISWGVILYLVYKLNAALRRLHFDIDRVKELDLSYIGKFGRIKLMEKMKDAFNEMTSTISGKVVALSTSSGKIAELVAGDQIDTARLKEEIASVKGTLNSLSKSRR